MEGAQHPAEQSIHCDVNVAWDRGRGAEAGTGQRLGQSRAWCNQALSQLSWLLEQKEAQDH